MPEHGSSQTIKHLALTYFLVCIFPAGSFFDFIQYANGGRLSTCQGRCKCNEKYRLVNCTDRAFRDIPDDIPPLTINLDFNWNFIKTLSSMSFANTRSVQIFSIAHNRLQTIENGTFYGLDNLTTIILEDNSLSELPSLATLRDLIHLDLSRNRISKIDGSRLSPSVRQLYLCENTISILDETSFIGLKNIEVINLSNNRVHVITENALACTSNLRGFTIVHNAIKTLPKGWLGNASRLEELYLTGNRLTWTTDVREWFTTDADLALKDLFLNQNHITSLPASAFRGIPKIETLVLNNNLLQYVPGTCFDDLINLQYLILSNNRLKSVPSEMVARNERLLTLVLRGNKLKHVPANLLENNLDLETLDLAGNKLSGLPKGLLGNAVYANFTQLDLRKNMFRNVPNLETLPSLLALIISNNRISKLGASQFLYNPLLMEIKLDFNNLQNLDPRTFTGLRKLKILSLKGNEFMCDCQMAWLAESHKKWAKEASKTVTCKYPYSVAVPSLYDMKSYDYADGVDTVQDMIDLCEGPKEKGKYLMIACIWILVVVLLLVVYWSRKVLKAQKRLNAGKPKIRRRYSLIPNKVPTLEKPPWNSFRRHSRKRNGHYTNLSKSSEPPRITVSCLPHSGMVYKQRETTV